MQELGPKPVFFEGEEPSEQVMLVLRAHFITNFGWVVIALLVMILTLFSLSLVNFLPIRSFVTPQTQLFLAAFVYLAVFGFALNKALNWYFNIYILTNKRLVDIDVGSVFYRKISQTTLDNIQDVSFSKGGFFQSLFDYGDIHVQTAGTLANFEFIGIPDPEGNQKQLLKLISMQKGKV